MDFTFRDSWIDILQELSPDEQLQYLKSLVLYAARGEEIDVEDKIRLLTFNSKKEIDIEKEKKRNKSILCSLASQRRTVKRGRNSFSVSQGLTTSNKVVQGTLKDLEEQDLSRSNNVLQGTLKDLDKNPATGCNIESYAVGVLSLDGEKGEFSYTHNTNRDLNNNLLYNNNNNLNSCTSNNGVCEEKKGGVGEKKDETKPKPKPRPRKTPEQKKAELEARRDDFHNEIRFYYGTYGEAYCEKFFCYYSKPNYITYKMRYEEKFGGFWNTEEKLKEWWDRDQAELQKQQLKQQYNGGNSQYNRQQSEQLAYEQRQAAVKNLCDRLLSTDEPIDLLQM